MKQVLTTINSIVRSFSSISPRRLFSKYRLVLMLAVIAMFISSCQKEDLHFKKTVPFKAEFIVTLTILKAGTPGVPEQDHVTGVGEGTPIGKATFDAYTQSDIFSPEPQLVTGKGSTIAENGDQIFSTTKGYAIGPDAKGDIKIVLNDVITGGTGKYAGATGGWTTLATANINTPLGTASEEGSITY